MNKETYTKNEVKMLIKAFHLDSVQGRYSKELLEFCDKWIVENLDDSLWQENKIVIYDGDFIPTQFIVNREKLTPEQYKEKYPLIESGELNEIKNNNNGKKE